MEISFELTPNANSVKIIIEDDGKGIDPEIIREVVSKNKSLKDLDIDKMSDQDVINLIFEAGLSSREDVSEISGRGVGMDVVKIEIQRLGGTIKVESEKGKGTKFEIVLPLLN